MQIISAAGGKRKLASVAIAGALALGFAACGDDDDEGSSDEAATEEATSAEEVTLTATEYEFELSATPTAETQTVTFDNQGEEPHVLIFARISDDYTLDEAFELEGKKGSATEVTKVVEAGPGESVEVEVEEPLEAGSYAMLCPLPGPKGEPHYKLGQLEEFDIE